MSPKIFTIISIFITLILIFSCNATKTLEQEENWSIALVKGGCMDVCQSYDFSINLNGEYSYKGKFKVKHKGKRSGNIEKLKLSELKVLLKKINWESLKDAYFEPALDPQKNIISYHSSSIKKEITYGKIKPSSIKDLENFINTLINQDEF